jgi:predicted MFS family arabinose efflux permease
LALLAEFRTLDPRVWVLTVARVIVTFGFSMVFPLLAVHLYQERSVPAVTVGLIWMVSGVTGAGAQWISGSIADRVGRRPVILTAMLLRGVNLALLGVAIRRQQPISVIGALIVANAVLRAFFDPVASAMVADLSAGEQRVAAFSLQRIGVNVGWAAGPIVSSLALDAGATYAGLFLWSAPVTLVAAAAVARIRETRLPRDEAAPRTRFLDLFHIPADPAFIRFLAATFALFLLQVQLYQTLSIYAARALQLSKAQVSGIYFLNGLLVVALQVPAFYFIRRIGTRQALVLGSLLYAASYASCGLAQGYASLLACVAAITLAEMISAPAQQTTATGMAPPGRIGAYAGLSGLAQAAGQSLGPLVGGWLFDRFGDRRIWAVLPLFGVIAAILYRPKLVAGQGRLGRANR